MRSRRSFLSAEDFIGFAGACLLLLSLMTKVILDVQIGEWADFLAI